MLPDQDHTRKNVPRRLQGIGFSFLLFLGVCTIFLPCPASAATSIKEPQRYIENGGYALQIQNRTIRAFNAKTPFIPASILKLVTSLMVLDGFGPQFRFTTPIYTDDQDNLYIRGSGDPFLTSEAVRRMANRLHEQEATSFHSLILDDSAFALEGPPPQSSGSDNPYDANNGALVVNFNTVNFEVDTNRNVFSGEQQTPLLPIMKDLARAYPQGRHRVNIGILAPEEVQPTTVRYCGELFLAIFKEQGITVTNGFSSGRVPPDARLLFNYVSQLSLAEVVQRCLLYSNNYIANQLFLLIGSQKFGTPATWKKAGKAAEQFLAEKLELAPNQAIMVDGSGLSTRNRISAEAMLVILHRFLPYYRLLPQEQGVYLKSGTLTNVYSYAGYFDSPLGKAPFVIMLNQRVNNRDMILGLLRNEMTRQGSPM